MEEEDRREEEQLGEQMYTKLEYPNNEDGSVFFSDIDNGAVFRATIGAGESLYIKVGNTIVDLACTTNQLKFKAADEIENYKEVDTISISVNQWI